MHVTRGKIARHRVTAKFTKLSLVQPRSPFATTTNRQSSPRQRKPSLESCPQVQQLWLLCRMPHSYGEVYLHRSHGLSSSAPERPS